MNVTTIEADERRRKSQEEDLALVAEAMNASERAYERLVKKYRDPIERFLTRMISSGDLARDLTQEIFIKCFTKLSTYNPEYNFSTWLYKIASNHCIDYIRRRKLKTFSIDEPTTSQDGDDYYYEIRDDSLRPDHALTNTERSKMIADAIATLPEKYRRVILLRHEEDKDYDEIATLLNLPMGTVKAHLFRARARLYKELKGKL